MRVKRFDNLENLFAVFGLGHYIITRLEYRAQEIAAARCVVRDQNAPGFGGKVWAGQRDILWARLPPPPALLRDSGHIRSGGQVEMELAALAKLAVHPDSAALHFDKLL